MDIEKLIYCEDDLEIFEIDNSTLDELSRIDEYQYDNYLED